MKLSLMRKLLSISAIFVLVIISPAMAAAPIFVGAADIGQSPNSSGTYSAPYTVGASSNYLIVSFLGNGGPCDFGRTGVDDITGVTYNGVAMSLLSKNTSNIMERFSYVYGLAAPAVGAHNVVVNWSDLTHTVIVGAADYSGVTGIDATANQTAGACSTTATTTVTSTQANDLVVLFDAGINNDSSPATAGAGATRRAFMAATGTWGIFDSNGGVPSGPYSMTVTRPNSAHAMRGIAAALKGSVTAPINGSCGSANGSSTTTAPTTNLCSAGAATTVSGAGPWTWSCNGSNGGTNASCSAPLQGASSCGTANGVAVSSAPTSGLCPSGQTASSVTGAGPWAWTCTLSGASPINCSAPVLPPSSSGTPETINWITNPNNVTIFHAPRAMTVTQIVATIDTPLGGVGTVKIRKVPAGTLHCSDAAGIDLTTSLIDANAGPGNQVMPITSPAPSLNAGDRVCIVTTGAGWGTPVNGINGAVTVTAQ